MKGILEHAEAADLEFLVKLLRSPLHLRRTDEMYSRLEEYRADDSHANHEALTTVIERQVRYSGSADLAYAARWVFRREPGVATEHIIHDVAKRLKVRIPAIGPTQAKLESLAEGVMAKELFRMSPEEQRKLIQDQGLNPKATHEAIVRIQKHGPIGVVPLLLGILGREALEELVTGLVTKAIGRLVGRDAARHLVANLAARFPLWSRWLGPAVWGMTGAWAVLDIQGPAYRKTIPAVLYISLIALRHSGKKKHKKREKHPADHASTSDDQAGESQQMNGAQPLEQQALEQQALEQQALEQQALEQQGSEGSAGEALEPSASTGDREASSAETKPTKAKQTKSTGAKPDDADEGEQGEDE